VSQNKVWNFGVTQGFLTGTTATFSYNNTAQEQNAIRNLFNPSTNSSFDLQVNQHLLQGWGMALNNRNIRVAKNNIKAFDYTFQQQVINTVASVIQQYWNLVSAIESVNVAQQALKYSQQLYENNVKQEEIGTLAPVEVTRARAEVATDTQTLITAQTTVKQQETNLKNLLSRNGVSNASLADATIVPTNKINIPDVEPVRPIQDLSEQALMKRPDLAQTRIQIENSKINLTGTRAAMLPTLDLVGDVRNNALTGFPNSLPGAGNSLTNTVNAPDPFFVGGYGNILSQLFGRNFPTYSIGAQLNIPLRNRSAQANMANAQLQLRQSELTYQKSINQVTVDIQNALTAVLQARARYDSAVQSVTLEEQLLDAEQKKFALGTSTPFQVIQVQRDLANAQQTEVQALTAYGLAKVQLDQAMGTTLENNHVEIDDAKSGRVPQSPSPIPPLDPGTNGTPNAANRR
jgi:outer membrane protein